MPEIDSGWSLESVLRNFKPHEGWRDSFADAYSHALESSSPGEQVRGWTTAAMILGDMNARVLCLFVCFYGRSLVPAESEKFSGHIDLCLLDMGLATAAVPGTVPAAKLGKPGTLRQEVGAVEAWMSDQLRPFGGDLRSAAEFSMRLTAIRLGLLIGPSEPSIEEILDAGLWRHDEPRMKASVPSVPEGKRWWQIWK